MKVYTPSPRGNTYDYEITYRETMYQSDFYQGDDYREFHPRKFPKILLKTLIK